MVLFFRLKRRIIAHAFFSLMLISLSQTTFAETSAEVKQQLQSIKNQVVQLETNLEKNTKTLSALQKKIAEEEEKLAPKLSEVAKAKSALQQAKANAQEDPSPENNSRVRNAELTLALTERRTERASSTLSEMQAEATKLEKQISADKKAKKSAETKVSVLSKKVLDLTSKEVKAAKEKALQEQAAREALEEELAQARAALEQMKQKQAEAEAERQAAEALKAAEAERQAAEALKAAEAEKTNQQNSPSTTTEVPIKTEESEVVENNRANDSLVTETKESPESSTPDLTTEQGFALFHHKRLQDALKSNNQTRASRSTGNFLRILNNGRTKTYQWKYATRDLWTLEAPVNDGENTFRIGRVRINKTIAPDKGGQMYIFLYNDDKPDELIMYRKELVE